MDEFLRLLRQLADQILALLDSTLRASTEWLSQHWQEIPERLRQLWEHREQLLEQLRGRLSGGG